MQIRAYQEPDEAQVVALWQACGLTRPWNDPNKDIARKLTVQRELFLVGELDGAVVATVMVGFEAIAAGSTIWRWCRRCEGAATVPR